MDQAEQLFIEERPRLVGLAYRMVGSVSDAEDIVSEAWTRWCATDTSELNSPEAWLTTVTTRLAIDWLRKARHDRESYVGPWLAEPVVTEAGPEEQAELADSLTLGFLTLLDRLDPVERAVFLMADVFQVPFSTISQAVDKTEPACRQIASRARRSLRNARTRARSHDRRVVDEVLVAIAMGDMDTVLRHVAPDVVCVTDGGAKVNAARRPVVGATRVARFLTNLAMKYGDHLSAEHATINGEPGVIGMLDGRVDFAAAFEVEDGLVRTIRLVRNPDKLRLTTSRSNLL